MYPAGLSGLMHEVVDWVGEHRRALMERDLLPELEKIFMEATGLLVLETRLSALKLDLPSESLPAKLINAAREVNSSVLATDNGLPFWKLWETRDFKRTKEGMETIARVAGTLFLLEIVWMEIFAPVKNGSGIKKVVKVGSHDEILLV